MASKAMWEVDPETRSKVRLFPLSIPYPLGLSFPPFVSPPSPHLTPFVGDFVVSSNR